MREVLDGQSDDRLVGKPYFDDFEKYFWDIGQPGFWKLERLQTFQEPRSESWLAYARGDWEESLRLHEARRPSIVEYYRKIADHGFQTRRVRVVEKPLTPYLQWEFQLLRIRDQLGGKVRVVSAEQVARFETDGPLPEINVLGAEVMYRLCYDENGSQEGGIRFTDPDLIAHWRKFIQDLYSVGEDLEEFFQREVATLEPPRRVADASRSAS
ncbi:MAG TPA: hypothetical protein VG317_17140 [Pseudonocardiaceae bacterium]|jgi:hypothetical protein|nr:hypothetical protein [Pseudonocardiaceae bacterium]